MKREVRSLSIGLNTNNKDGRLAEARNFQSWERQIISCGKLSFTEKSILSLLLIRPGGDGKWPNKPSSTTVLW